MDYKQLLEEYQKEKQSPQFGTVLHDWIGLLSSSSLQLKSWIETEWLRDSNHFLSGFDQKVRVRNKHFNPLFLSGCERRSYQ